VPVNVRRLSPRVACSAQQRGAGADGAPGGRPGGARAATAASGLCRPVAAAAAAAAAERAAVGRRWGPPGLPPPPRPRRPAAGRLGWGDRGQGGSTAEKTSGCRARSCPTTRPTRSAGRRQG
jgi:hypothetical protein